MTDVTATVPGPVPSDGTSTLLELRDLRVHLKVEDRLIRAVDGVDLRIGPREKVALVGESGSGKSMTGKASMLLLPKGARTMVSGEILYRGEDISGYDERQMSRLRGGEISMVFQDPMTFLNPTMRIGRQIGEAVRIHHSTDDDVVDGEVDEALRLVGLSPESGVASRYPFELSGGMRQRVLMAIALACRPKVMIADEPTTALDVTVQAQVLNTLDSFTDRLQMALLLITHDLGIVASLCDRVYVMYAGQIVEEADTFSLFERPAHPYTRGLLEGVVSIDEFRETLTTIPGTVPDLSKVPSGCRFRERCSSAMEICRTEPPVYRHESGGSTRCWLYGTDEAEMNGWQQVQIRGTADDRSLTATPMGGS